MHVESEAKIAAAKKTAGSISYMCSATNMQSIHLHLEHVADCSQCHGNTKLHRNVDKKYVSLPLLVNCCF